METKGERKWKFGSNLSIGLSLFLSRRNHLDIRPALRISKTSMIAIFALTRISGPFLFLT